MSVNTLTHLEDKPMGNPRIVVMSDFHTIGTTVCGVEFIPIPPPPGPDILNEDEREIEEIMAVRAASRIIVRLGNSDVIFLQHLAGNVMGGGPIDANDVLQQISFADIGTETGETEEQVRRRLIVFVTSPEEAEDDMPVIGLQHVYPEDLKIGRAAMLLRHHHPFARILHLAEEAKNK